MPVKHDGPFGASGAEPGPFSRVKLALTPGPSPKGRGENVLAYSSPQSAITIFAFVLPDSEP